jgi:hypothetical protein
MQRFINWHCADAMLTKLAFAPATTLQLQLVQGLLQGTEPPVFISSPGPPGDQCISRRGSHNSSAATW